jgi:thiamine biosynthesis protein ThiC
MKKNERNDSFVKEYVQRLSEDDLTYLQTRFQQKLAGDAAQIADYLSRNREIDRWLASARSNREWFEMFEYVGQTVQREIIHRGKEVFEKITT